MNATQRGCRSLAIVGGVFFIFVILIPFIVLPAAGQAVTLPVITLPAEYYRKDWPSPSFELVNTLGGALLANIIVWFIMWRVWRASKGWTNRVPGRFQAAIELIVEVWWNLTKQQAGNTPKTRKILMPLVASIFMFLLAANLGKLLPGVESVGVLHCAAYEPTTFNGVPVNQHNLLGRPYFTYRIEGPLNTGTPATSDSYYQCEALLGEHKYIKDGYLPEGLDPFYDEAVTVEVSSPMTLQDVLADAEGQLQTALAEPLPESDNRLEIQEELANSDYEAIKVEYSDPFAVYGDYSTAETEFSIGRMLAANSNAAGLVTLEFEHGDEEHHGDPVTVEYNGTVYTLPEGATLESQLAEGQTVIVREELFGEQATTLENQLFTIAPFVRGVSTDLSFTIGLSLLAFVMIQYFGLSTLGPDYLQKFINLRAIGNAGSNPLGVIDFVVGLFEIVSEFGKIISLSFRLFGAIFAGGILFVVFMFLTGTMIPVIIMLLELIVGFAQAGVFAVLTLIFCAQAMVSHHHDDEHGHDDHH